MLESHEHLARILALEQANKGLGGICDAVDDRLLPLDLVRSDPGAHIGLELGLPIEVVGNDKTREGQPLAHSQTQIPWTGRRCSFIVTK